MIYVITIGHGYILTQEHPFPIFLKVEVIQYFIEVLIHPGQSIPMSRLNLLFKAFDVNPIPYLDYLNVMRGDYIKRCYKMAEEEQACGRLLYSIYKELEEERWQKSMENSDVEAEYYRDKMNKIGNLIGSMTCKEKYLDSFIRKVNHSMYNTFRRLIASFEENSPQLHKYLKNTIDVGFSVSFNPERDSSLEIVIKDEFKC